MDNLKQKLKQQAKKIGWHTITTVIITLTAVFTFWVYAAFIEPTAGPNDAGWNQDFAQNILGANNADNSFNSSLVVASSTGSIIEQLEYVMNNIYAYECSESSIAAQTNCFIDDTARYLTTDPCNENKENQCFIPTDNSYYAFGSECSDSTTTAVTNCYVDDTVKYVDSGACSAGSNSGYCFMNTATFSAMDADLVAGNIKNGVTILGVTGTLASAKDDPNYPDLIHIATFIEPSSGPNDSNQDFAQDILGANNADNDFDSSSVIADRDGSIIERTKYLVDWRDNGASIYSSECGESTTATQTNCHVDDTARYLTTNLCNSAKENSCFVPTNNSYYAFNTECSDSTTSTQTNCYVDDTARYVDSNTCSAASNTGNCYVNAATFTALDADLVAANIEGGTTIFGVTGTYQSCGNSNIESPEVCDDGGTSWTVGNCAADCLGVNYWSWPTTGLDNLNLYASNAFCVQAGFSSAASINTTQIQSQVFHTGYSFGYSYLYGTIYPYAPYSTWTTSLYGGPAWGESCYYTYLTTLVAMSYPNVTLTISSKGVDTYTCVLNPCGTSSCYHYYFSRSTKEIWCAD